jgi:putative colanic acid biosynthesis acetyltransferase WcaF
MPLNKDTFREPSFSLRNRLGRVIWGFVGFFFFRLSPRPLHGWRRFLLRLFGAGIGRGAHIYPGAKIWAPWNVEIGEESGIADGAVLYSQGRITVGRRCVISQEAYLCGGTHNFERPGFPLETAPIVLGDHVWVAARAFVHPGVTLGAGCVVGACAVVLKDLPAWTVCGGFPAQPLRPRTNFSENDAPSGFSDDRPVTKLSKPAAGQL